MHETIKELGKVLFICEARMHPIIKRSFPDLVVGCAGLTVWSTTNVRRMVIYHLEVFLEGIEAI